MNFVIVIVEKNIKNVVENVFKYFVLKNKTKYFIKYSILLNLHKLFLYLNYVLLFLFVTRKAR